MGRGGFAHGYTAGAKFLYNHTCTREHLDERMENGLSEKAPRALHSTASVYIQVLRSLTSLKLAGQYGPSRCSHVHASANPKNFLKWFDRYA